MNDGPPRRIVLAKIGLDGHDRGIKVVARGLRDSGFHVIYAGLWQSAEAVVRAVADEDADWLGLSILSGAHLTLVPPVLELLHRAGLCDVGVIVGGIVPEHDLGKLAAMGVAHVFGPGTVIAEIAQFLRDRPVRSRASPESLVEQFRGRDRRALARLLSVAARGEQSDTIEQAIQRGKSRATVVAITGAGGVGKSTLLGKLAELVRRHGRTVAVLACDPQSAFSGGALLGDRIRMPSRPDDDGMLIRSLATPAGHQGVAPNLNLMARLSGAFGFDLVLVETVGAGQGDTAVRHVADIVVVLVQPATGDELQWQKAGQLEIADVVVVHKADLPGSEFVVSQLKELFSLPGCGPVPIIPVSSNNGQGLEALYDAIESASAARAP
jgi:LAO/AO transport system ATPase